MHNHSVSNENQSAVIYRRSASFERSAVNLEQRTAELTFSSEAPVARKFGVEILDHSPTSVRMERLNAGGPLLFGHDSTRMEMLLGSVEKAWIGDDKRGRALVSFDNSPEGDKALRKAADGSLRNVSVGYILHDEPKAERSADGATKFRFMDWEPYEVSLVTIPADHSVGIGREFAPVVEDLPTNDGTRQGEVTTAEAEIKAEVKRMSEVNVGLDAAKAERERVSEIHAMERQYPKILSRNQAEKFVGEGSGVDAVRKFILDEQIKAGKENEVRNLNKADLSDKEKKQYSVTAALRKLSGDASGSEGGFEEEVSNTLAKKLGKAARGNGFYIPMDIPMRAGDLDRARALRSGEGVQTRAGLDTNSTASGEFTVFTEYVSLIELLRNQLVVRKLGATMLSGLSDNIAFPKQATAGSAYWVADNPGVDVADSNLTFAQITMSPKLLQSSTSFSRKLLLQSSVDVEALVRQDLMAVMALAIDLAALAGTGVNNQPLGILNQTGIGSYVTGGNSLSAAVNGSNYGFDMLNELETQIAEANADALGAAAYLTTPRVRKKLKVTPEMGNTIALPIWQGSEANGYRAEVSNQVPKVETGGGTPYLAHSLIYGIWNQLIIGEWGALEVITDPYRLKKQGMIEVTTFDTCDVNVRHPQAFGAATDINPLI